MATEYKYQWWRSAAENLLQPLANLMQTGNPPHKSPVFENIVSYVVRGWL